MILFFDTETTGFPDRALPREHPSQPHLVQIAAALTEDDGTERASLSVIVKPDGYEIPAQSTTVHGITTEVASRCGVPLSAAMWAFICMRAQASMIVAHNAKFDMEVIQIAMTRLPKRDYQGGAAETFCTMERATPIVNLPPTAKMLAANMRKPKPPKLEEAYLHFFGELPAGAHDAFADMRACQRIFWHLKSLETAR